MAAKKKTVKKVVIPPPFGECDLTKTRMTAFVKWPDGGVEEVDCNAETSREAKPIIEAILKRDYNPGGKIIRWHRKVPGIIYF